MLDVVIISDDNPSELSSSRHTHAPASSCALVREIDNRS